MKTNFILFCLLIVSSIQAQNLEQYISRDAKAVVEIDGGQIFSLIDFSDIEMMMPPGPEGPMNLEDLGINIKSKAYYFYETRESMDYQNVVFGLTDMKKAEEFISSMMPGEPKMMNGFKVIMQDGTTAAWNNNTAILSYANFPKKVYTIEELRAEKEAERIANQEMAEEEEGAEEVVEEEEVTDDYGYGDYNSDYNSDEDLALELMLKNMDAPPLHSVEEMTRMMSDNFMGILNTNSKQSIRNVNSYTSGKKSNSSAYFWLKNLDDLMKDAMPKELTSMIPGGGGLAAGGLPTGMTNISSNLIFDKDEMRWESNLGLNPSIADSYSKIYSKIDKSFLNHFDQDDVLSYMSFSTDTEKMMQEYPSIMQKLYGSFFPDFSEEIGIGMDLMEIIFDEEAIGELITGDGLMILHKVEEHEVTYMATEYDNDFNATQVEKTRMEPLPIFSMMMGSENKKVVSKLMRLAKKYGVANIEGNHHRIPAKDMGAPFDMYFAHNDGIVYFTNSKTKVGNYATGKKTKNLGKHKKILRNNAFNMYVNSTSVLESLSGVLPMDSATMSNLKDNYKEMHFSSGKIENNSMNMDLVMKTSGAYGNALKLILNSMTSSLKGI